MGCVEGGLNVGVGIGIGIVVDGGFDFSSGSEVEMGGWIDV